jgi:hypothetical protein
MKMTEKQIENLKRLRKEYGMEDMDLHSFAVLLPILL